MLNINPKMLPRLDEIEDDLMARRTRAEQKREETKRLARIAPVDLGMPVLAEPR
jgi:hypothetical protein